MNALALYRLTSCPAEEKEVVKVRPSKRPKTIELAAETVEYVCHNCKQPVHLSANDPVLCERCRSRIVTKIVNAEPRTYNAV